MTELEKKMIRLLAKMKEYVRHTDECYYHPDCSCGAASILQEVDDIIKKEKESHKLTEQQKELILYFLDGADRIQKKMGWTLEEFRAAALDAHIEQCPFCKMWCESSDLIAVELPCMWKCDNCKDTK